MFYKTKTSGVISETSVKSYCTDTESFDLCLFVCLFLKKRLISL